MPANTEHWRALPLLLSLNAGFVDTAGFLALQGLFTAHVTGNFVTLGASLVLGTSGAIAKLLALPVFCVVVIAIRLLSSALLRRQLPALKIVLAVKLLLLIAGAVLAVHFGPFAKWRCRAGGADRHGAGGRDGDPECRAPNSSRQRAAVDVDDRHDHPDHDGSCGHVARADGAGGWVRSAAGAHVGQHRCFRAGMRRGGLAVCEVRGLVFRGAANSGGCQLNSARKPIGSEGMIRNWFTWQRRSG
jgi:hypothetical protein